MHELQVTKSIHQIVLKHAIKSNVNRVVSVNLEIGALSDLQNEWIQRYFDKLLSSIVVIVNSLSKSTPFWRKTFPVINA